MARSLPPTTGRRAATAVETALVLGVLLVFVLAVIEFGRFLMVRQLLDNAARDGARQAVTGTSTLTTANIQTVVSNDLVGQPLQNLTIQVYQADPATGANLGPWTGAPFGSAIAVQASGSYRTMLPGFHFLPTSVPMTATAVMRSEAN